MPHFAGEVVGAAIINSFDGPGVGTPRLGGIGRTSTGPIASNCVLICAAGPTTTIVISSAFTYFRTTSRT